MIRKLLSVATIFVALAMSGYAQVASSEVSSRTPFRVRDSIEMRTFSDPFTRNPGAVAKEAPDGRGFVVVTTQGHLKANALESCLWYFSRRSLESFLKQTGAHPPHPELLFRKMGIPEAEQSNSYGSLITDVLWTSDSESLLMLVEQPHGNHHLYRVWLSGGRSVDLTPNETGDVSSPTLRAGTFAYLVSMSEPHVQGRGAPASTVLTGKSIYNILLPDKHPEMPGVGPRWKLRVRFNDKVETFPKDSSTFFPFSAVGTFQPQISPDGKSLLTVTPVADIPLSWSAYWSAVVTRRFVPATQSSDRSGRQAFWPWQYSRIDLASGRTEPLVNAPTGFVMSVGSAYEAKWSPSGDTVLTTYTYLPLDSTEDYADDSVKPCAVAEYTVKTHTTICIAETPSPELGEYVMSVGYDPAGEIVVKWMIRGERISRIYDRKTKHWTAENGTSGPRLPLALFIQQDMDISPTLWARQGSNSRMVWNPNPQFEDLQLGHALPYHWTDSSGYTWRGGLILPPGPKPKTGYPLVIQTHGFYNDHEFLVDGAYTTASAAQPLATSGIAVLQMEDRAGRHSRPAAEEANDEVKGIESAIDHLAKEQSIDPSRIGLEGFSRTSWYVETALEHSPLRYKAAILCDGVDMSYVQGVLFFPGSPDLPSDIQGPYGAPPFGTGLIAWIAKAPGFNLDRIETPIRIEAHGIASVLAEWEIYSMLLQQGKPVDFIRIPKGQHILQKPTERYASQQGAVDWFRFWLQGYKRPDAEDKAQYQRWTEMRAAPKMH